MATVANAGPLQPAALAVTVEIQVHDAEKETAPVEEFIEFPPAMLAASREYVKPVKLVAVVEYTTVPAPWQRVTADGL